MNPSLCMQACNAFLPQPAQLPDSLSNGDGEIRTLDPLLARQVLSQLSYTPIWLFYQYLIFKTFVLNGLEWTRTTDLTLIRRAL